MFGIISPLGCDVGITHQQSKSADTHEAPDPLSKPLNAVFRLLDYFTQPDSPNAGSSSHERHLKEHRPPANLSSDEIVIH